MGQRTSSEVDGATNIILTPDVHWKIPNTCITPLAKIGAEVVYRSFNVQTGWYFSSIVLLLLAYLIGNVVISFYYGGDEMQ